MTAYKLILRLLAVFDVLFSEKFVLTAFKNDRQTSKTNFDKREFKKKKQV